MKLLAIDTEASSLLDWCLRAIEDGHDVRLFVQPNPRNEKIGKGLVQRVADWRDHVRWADLVLVGGNDAYVKELDAFREKGARIVGPNVAGTAWEIDRDEGMKVLERAGIDTPPSEEFGDYGSAIAYVKQRGDRLVCKPSGIEADKSLSYCSNDAGDMVEMLERWKRAKRHKGKFILQDFVKGIEFGVAGWFGPGGFIEGWEEAFEEKKFMHGGKHSGPNTGEMGTVQRFVKKSKLAAEMLKPLEDQLDAIGYVGNVSVNCIIDEKGKPHPLEFTMRPGWPAFNIQMALQKGDSAEWLMDLWEGRDPRCFDLDRVAVGVVLTLPDFPHNKRPAEDSDGLPVYGLTASLMPNIHPCMMQICDAHRQVGDRVVKTPCLATAGTYVLVATGTGETVREAQKGAYRVINRLSVPGDSQVRPDVGRRLRKQLPDLQKHGYAMNMEF